MQHSRNDRCKGEPAEMRRFSGPHALSIQPPDAMPRATRAFHNRIALVFDFDGTLAPSSFDTLIESLGADAARFRQEKIQPFSDAGWNDTLARFYVILEEARERGIRLTKDYLEDVGRKIRPFPEVPEMFGRVRRYARNVSEDVQVEFYLLSCGFVDMHRGMQIASEFNDMWGSEFHFDDSGEAVFIRKMISFPEKERYLLGMSKGVGLHGANTPSEIYRDVPEHEVHVPMTQLIYVGDGGSDMPAFSLVNDHGGLAIGVFESDDPSDWPNYDKVSTERRVQNLAPAHYGEDSELMVSIRLAVESICKQIELRRLSRGE